MKSRLPKVLHHVLGYPLIEYVLRAVSSLSPSKVIVVVGHGDDAVREYLMGRGVVIAEAGEGDGEGHELRAARDTIRAPRFLVLPGDVPLVPIEALELLLREHVAKGALVTLLSFSPENPRGHGRVVRDGSGIPKAIVEEEDGSPDMSSMGEASSGICCVENEAALWEALERLSGGARGGGRLAEVISALYPRTWAVEWPVPEDLLGVDTRGDLARLEGVLRGRIVARLQDEGVTVVDPDTAFIGPDVEVSPDTVIHPSVYIYGKSRVGESCEIGPNAYLRDTELGCHVKVWFSVLEEAYVADGASIGPYAHLRPGARIGRGARIGNFVEIKNAEIGDGVRAGHLAYIGDAEVGEGTNIGAGTITCNYDGVRKHRTVIGKGAFIGSNTSLVAPVTVGEGAVVGAGSVITEDVPPYALALGRARQVTKPDWATRRKRGEGG